jgi:hypothetical protein
MAADAALVGRTSNNSGLLSMRSPGDGCGRAAVIDQPVALGITGTWGVKTTEF